jgi:hypothetical protein
LGITKVEGLGMKQVILAVAMALAATGAQAQDNSSRANSTNQPTTGNVVTNGKESAPDNNSSSQVHAPVRPAPAAPLTVPAPYKNEGENRK